jgi:glycosyltransferase involved in cell wall biosynthesis
MSQQKGKRKILFVMQLPPPIHGVSVMNQIIKNSAHINNLFECDYVNLATAKNVDDLQKSSLRKYFLTLKILVQCKIKMLFNRYDYVYVTVFPYGFAFFKDAMIVLLARLFFLKPILHLHTYGFKKNSESSSWRKRFYKFVFKNSHVICLSELLIEDIENLHRGEVFILPNGIPKVNSVNSYDASTEPVTLLYLSNLIKGKGILLIMDAVEMLRKKNYQFKLRVVGPEGDVDYKTLERIVAEKNISDVVTLVGPKFGEEKYAEFRKAGVFLLPSDYDTFGLVLLEAMQFGVPCVSTRIGGIPDVIGDGRGVLIDEITAPALAKGIEYLLINKDERKRMSKEGFEYFNNNFTIDIFEKRLADILKGNPGKVITKLLKHQA